MSPNEYQALALRTMADQATIRIRNYQYKSGLLGGLFNSECTDEEASIILTQLDNAARGMSGDVGEVNTCVQRCLEYGKPLDVANLKEELGDVLWRICQACDAVGLTLEEVMLANINKLAVRYGDEYSDFKAAEENRNREIEAKAMVGVDVARGKDFSAPLVQPGQWWAEPKLDDTDAPAGTHFTREQIRTGNNYSRSCAKCGYPIHNSNPLDVCASCYKPPVTESASA